MRFKSTKKRIHFKNRNVKKWFLFFLLLVSVNQILHELGEDNKTERKKYQPIYKFNNGLLIDQNELDKISTIIDLPRSSSPGYSGDPINNSYIIITTNAIKTNSTELDNFIRYKENIGFNVEVITEDDYGSAQGLNRSLNIRSWLQTHLNPKKIEYALLVGDPDPATTNYDSVPMLTCWPREHESTYRYTYTDHFYADLTGNWDTDDDDLYGEYNDDSGVDFDPEVYVGRIPVYGSDYSALDDILLNTRVHHNQTHVHKDDILVPMAISNYANEDGSGYDRSDGLHLPEELYRYVLDDLGMNDTVLYERAGLDPVPVSAYHFDDELTQDTFETYFNYGQGAVFWWAHGSSTSAARKYWSSDDGDNIPEGGEMSWPSFSSSGRVSYLNTESPAFIYQSSCNNGNPENTNNLGYALLKRGAAITTVSAAQVSWYAVGTWNASIYDGYTDNTGLGYKYMEYILANNMTTGEALAIAKGNGGEGWGAESWMNKMDFNLYGDPQLNYWGSQKSSCSTPTPSHNSEDIPSSIDLEVYVEDPDSHSLTVSFYNGSDDSLLGRHFDVANATTSSISLTNLANDTTYEWYVVVGDNQTYYYSDIWNFTTFNEPASPTWEQTPVDQEHEFGTIFSYDINATDPSDIDTYFLNDTSNFAIDTEGNLTSIGILPIGEYNLEISVNDTLGNLLAENITITVQDTIDPSWDSPTTTFTFELGTIIDQPLLISDLSPLSDVRLNDTSKFGLNATYYLQNSTQIPVGTYPLQVIANDTSGNQLIQEFSVAIIDTTSPTWLIAPENITIFNNESLSCLCKASDLALITYTLNDTTLFSISTEGIIQNHTIMITGVYHVKVTATDASDNVISKDIIITVEKSDDNTTDNDTPDDDTTDDDTTDDDTSDDDTSSDGNNQNNDDPVLFFGILGVMSITIIMILSKAGKK